MNEKPVRTARAGFLTIKQEKERLTAAAENEIIPAPILKGLNEHVQILFHHS